jgi:Leucine-rich repeat (LRR) protein
MRKSYFLFSSIATMTSLTDLDLYNNDLSRDDQLVQTLSALTNLELLYLGYCQLTKIPER